MRQFSATKALIYIAAIYITALFIYSVIIVPRPYYIQTTDLENDVYYNARLIYNGFPAYTVTHPGTPIHYGLSKVMLFTGEDISQTQKFLNVSYFFEAILNLGALIIFILLILRREVFWFAFFMFTLVLSSPHFITYQNYVGGDASTVMFGLPIASFVWYLLGKKEKSPRELIACGILFGFAAAVKVSFLLLILPIFAALLFSAFLHKDFRGLKLMALMPLISLCSFLFFISRVIHRLPTIISQILNGGFSIDRDLMLFLKIFIANIKYLFIERPFLTFVVSLVIISFLLISLLYVRQIYREKRFFAEDTKLLFPRLIFSVGGIAVLGYTLAVIGDISDMRADGEELGVIIRNTAAGLIFLPFIAQTLFVLIGSLGFQISKGMRVLFVVMGILIMVEAIGNHIIWRNNMISGRMASATRAEKQLRALISPNDSFAIWSTDAKYAFGEAIFHYWGNRRDGFNFFDKDVTEYFGNIKYFDFRNADPFITHGQFDTLDSNYPFPELLQKHRILAKAYLKWREWFPPSRQTDDIITGERKDDPPAAIMFPDAERRTSSAYDSQLIKLIEYRFDVRAEARQVYIEGNSWTIITLTKNKVIL